MYELINEPMGQLSAWTAVNADTHADSARTKSSFDERLCYQPVDSLSGNLRVDFLDPVYVLLYMVHRGRQCGRNSHLSNKVSLSSW